MENRKKAYQEGIERYTKRRDEVRGDPVYLESRRLWKEYIYRERKITATELGERLGIAEYPKAKQLKDLFGGKEI